MPKKSAEESVKNKKSIIDFNFPAYGVTVQACSIEEAEEKLQDIIANNKSDE